MYRASLIEMSSETEAQIEGAKNLYRYNRSDLFNVAVWIGLFAVVGVLAFVGTHLIDALPHSHPIPACPSVQACQHWIITHPLHIKPQPGFPVFKP